MAWLGKVSLGGFPDLAGAVTKFSESVKNIEKNFDSALGLEEKGEGGSGEGEVSGIWSSGSDGKGFLSFMGNKGDDGKAVESLENVDSTENSLAVEAKIFELPPSVSGNEASLGRVNQMPDKEVEESNLEEVSGNEASLQDSSSTPNIEVQEFNSQTPETTSDTADETQKDIAEGLHVESEPLADTNFQVKDPEHIVQEREEGESHSTSEASVPDSMNMVSDAVGQMESCETTVADDSQNSLDNKQQTSDSQDQEKGETESMESIEKVSLEHVNIQGEDRPSLVETGTPDSSSSGFSKDRSPIDLSSDQVSDSLSTMEVAVKLSGPDNQQADLITNSAEVNSQTQYTESDGKEHSLDSGTHVPQTLDADTDLEKVKKEMKMMEAALQGAARQSQAKADEIAKLMNENEQLKSTVEDLQKKSLEAENDALREEYHQRVSTLERKVYALTRERDTLRREQNKKSDVAILLKEKDEIISQVMAEGENLSKKQAAQESTIRKLRAQIREFDEEKQRLNSKLQVEEAKVESMKRDKAATEKLLQETIEKNQADLAAQKEFYTNALNAAKEAEALAEAQANNEAKIELENRLREASERESMLVQTLDELRQTLSRTERQAVFREDMLQKDIDELQKRYQASELRYNELITQVPESTRPLLRQIEAMQESAARKAEAWAGVEKNLNSRLEAAEAKAAASEEKERLMNERLSQTLSRMTVLETQIACLRTEQTQLSRSLEKERQRAAESRQEYLVAMEEVATHEGRAKQLEDELRELRAKHKHDLQEALVQKELLEKELEREKATRLELENSARLESSHTSQDLIAKHIRSSENGSVLSRRLSSAGSQSSMEESYFLQASLDSSENTYSDRRAAGEISPYYLKSMTPSAFEAALRHKDGELASYISRVASLEAIRDSLAEELVKMTAQCEKLQAEVALLPGVRAELEALRRRHSSALELMGERDEELEELRADIIDLKEMYREQVDLLVNKIQTMGGST